MWKGLSKGVFKQREFSNAFFRWKKWMLKFQQQKLMNKKLKREKEFTSIGMYQNSELTVLKKN